MVWRVEATARVSVRTRAMRPQLWIVAVVLLAHSPLRVYAQVNPDIDSASPAPDVVSPSQVLTTDRLRPATRIVASLVLRVPFDRAYGLAIDYAPCGFVAVGAVVSYREDRRLELGTSVALRTRDSSGGLLRATASVLVAGGASAAPAAYRLDLGVGYGAMIDGVYFEGVAGASYRRGAGFEVSPWAVYLAGRIGFGF